MKLYRLQTIWDNGSKTNEYQTDEDKAWEAYNTSRKYLKTTKHEMGVELYRITLDENGIGSDRCLAKYDRLYGDC